MISVTMCKKFTSLLKGNVSDLFPIYYQPWLCLLCVIIGSMCCYIVPLYWHLTGNLSHSGMHSTFDDYKIVLLMTIVITVPMLVDAVLDCAHTMISQEDRILWYTKALTLTSIIGPNMMILMEFCGNLDGMGYQHSVQNFRNTTCGCTMAYASVIALKYNMKDVSGLCVLISILAAISYSTRSLCGALDPIGEYLFKIATLARIIAYFVLFYSLRLWSRKVQSASNEITCVELILMVKLSSALISKWSFDATEIYFQGANESNTSANCIRFYGYVQMIYTVVSIAIPGRIARYEVSYMSRALIEKKAFIRHISHEIRTTLNTVFLGLEYITSALKQIPTEESHGTLDPIVETVSDVYSSCEVAISILNDLLTSDKIEGGKMTLDLDCVNCCSYFTSLAKLFNMNAREKSITFIVDCSNLSSSFSHSASINVDQAKMGQVIRNLISNALKFTPHGGTVTVSISHVNLRDRSDGRATNVAKSWAWPSYPAVGAAGIPAPTMDMARIEVRDTGAGISLSNQAQLFGQYVQFNANKLQQGKGSGLGLWISKGITELHGGTIGAFSEGEGKGSMFYVELPVIFSRKEHSDVCVDQEIASVAPLAVARNILSDCQNSVRNNCPDLNAECKSKDADADIDVRALSTANITKGVNSRQSSELYENLPVFSILNSTLSTDEGLKVTSEQHLMVDCSNCEFSNPHTTEWSDNMGEDKGKDAKLDNVDGDHVVNESGDQAAYIRNILPHNVIKEVSSTTQCKQYSSSFPSSPRILSPLVSEKESLHALAKNLKENVRTSISNSVVSTSNSTDLLSGIYPFIMCTKPFLQSKSSSLTDSMRYESVSTSSLSTASHCHISESKSNSNSNSNSNSK